MKAHWSRNTFVRTRNVPDIGWQEGYCMLCGADMTISEKKVKHYNSHKNKKLGGAEIRFKSTGI